jgi:hypothetical protein
MYYMHVSHTLGEETTRAEEGERERTILFSCSCAEKAYEDFLLSGRREGEEKRSDAIFFLLLLPANKIDRIQNVATKNPFSGKREKKRRKKAQANANTYIYKHTYRHTKSIKILRICIN